MPNAALRFTPDSGDASGGIQIGPKQGSGGFGVAGQTKTATIGRGSQQLIYVLGADGRTPRAIRVTIGSSNGTLTSVTGSGLKPGTQVITGRVAAASA